jgi:hypothetical protein
VVDRGTGARLHTSDQPAFFQAADEFVPGHCA